MGPLILLASALALPLGFVRFHSHDRFTGCGRFIATPPLAGRWNFDLPGVGSIAPKLGIAIPIGDHHHGYYDSGRAHVDRRVAFVVRKHMNDRVAFTMRAGFPVGFQAGFTF